LTSDLSPAWRTLADLLDPLPNPYLNDPVGLVTGDLGEFIRSKQALLMDATTKYRKTVVEAAHSVGKTRPPHRLGARGHHLGQR
jgi:hypothetical protein